MDARFSRASVTGADPHQWQTFEQYRIVHDQRLADHPFLDLSSPDTLVFEMVRREGDLLIHLEGDVYCIDGVTLKVEKWFETRTVRGLLQVRGLIYRYIGYVPGEVWVLKYHSLHRDRTEYIHRILHPDTGQVESETLTRNQFPIMTQVLDELELLTELR